MMNYWFGPMGWIGMIISMVIWLIVVGGIIWLVVWAIRRASQGGFTSTMTPPAGQSPKDIAQMRYARGEITREQYQQILEDLNK